MLELTAIRLLLVGHPVLEERAATGGPLLDQAAIDAVQIVTRRLSSSPGMLDALEENLTPEDFSTDAAGQIELLIDLGWPQ